MPEQTMQAVRIHEYGPPEVLTLEQAPRPQPAAGEVLVRVYAAGVNPMDWKYREGRLQAFMPLEFPWIPGADLAGVVEQVGPGVNALRSGQAVFGQTSHGAYAEYAAASASTLALKPERLSFDAAATIPVGAVTAWQALFDHGNLQPGQRVLIQGAAGGVGMFGVQFARWKGAHVVGTASTVNVEFVRSLGAETVVDYTTTPVESAVAGVDLVLDTVGGATLEPSLRALRRGGTLVPIAGAPPQERAQELGVRVVTMAARASSELLTTIARLIDEGHVRTEVGRTLALSEARQAHELSQTGRGRGRIVLHVAD